MKSSRTGGMMTVPTTAVFLIRENRQKATAPDVAPALRPDERVPHAHVDMPDSQGLTALAVDPSGKLDKSPGQRARGRLAVCRGSLARRGGAPLRFRCSLKWQYLRRCLTPPGMRCGKGPVQWR